MIEPTLETESQVVKGGIKSLSSTVLDLPPSCVEFSRKNPAYFVVGTYNLEKETEAYVKNDEFSDNTDCESPADKKKNQSRNGSLILFKITEGELNLIHTVTHPSAILDLHFSPHEPHLFAVASSTGSIALYELQELPRYGLVHLHTYQSFPISTLVLSLVFHSSFTDIIGVTLSTSTVALLKFSSNYSSLTVLRDDVNPHSNLEAWTLAFSPPRQNPKTKNSPQAVYSGGDDSRLRCTTFRSLSSLRHSANDLSLASPGGVKGMLGHDAGVTAILPLPLDLDAGKDILITGSYDDHIRVYAVYDHRPDSENTRPKVLAELNLGGGVWRLKFLRDHTLAPLPSTDGMMKFKVLASCMHAGARILELKGCQHGEWSIKILAKFEEHKSMNYGSDVQPPSQDDTALVTTRSIFVSTSFYDRLLCVWPFEEV